MDLVNHHRPNRVHIVCTLEILWTVECYSISLGSSIPSSWYPSVCLIFFFSPLWWHGRDANDQELDLNQTLPSSAYLKLDFKWLFFFLFQVWSTGLVNVFGSERVSNNHHQEDLTPLGLISLSSHLSWSYPIFGHKSLWLVFLLGLSWILQPRTV